jgi:aldehyde:ferredoxin oxidoreductase
MEENKAAAPANAPTKPAFPGGYNGKILRVNLTDNTLTPEILSDKFCRLYMGGAGFIAYYLWKEMKPGIDPLGPDNKLIFALGPVTGLAVPGASRNCIGAKSPLTGGIAKSEVGGFWMAELKRAGYDALIVEGQAPKPVYLWIHDGEAEIKNASQLWGKETRDAQSAIRSELGDEHIQVAVIGQAGENKVRFACIMEGLHDAAGRGGLGAVMGSKNLKAVAVRGHILPPVANEEKVKEIRQKITALPAMMAEYGTGGPEMMMMEARGVLPIRNFRDGVFPEVNQVNGKVIKETIRVGMEGCYACPIRCKKVVKFEEPYVCDPAYGGPEYESLGALGTNCGVSDLKAVCKANERCNAHSLDVISTGDAIAFAMECYERGLLTQKDTGGLDFKFGNSEAMLAAIELIVNRQGFGNFLAEGSARMAKQIGQGSEEFAMNVKGLDAAMPDARMSLSFAVGYMVNPHGADHVSCDSPRGMLGIEQFGIMTPVPEGINPRRMSLFKLMHCLIMVQDLMVICSFPGFDWDTKLDFIKAVTGWNTSWVELIKTGERVLTLMRLFNIREGFTANDDKLPGRYFQNKTDRPMPVVVTGDPANMENAKQLYYSCMGWDSLGVPRPEKVEELYIE